MGVAIPAQRYNGEHPPQISLKLEDSKFGNKYAIGLGGHSYGSGASVSYAHIESNAWATDIKPNTQYNGIDVSLNICGFSMSFGSYLENGGDDSFEEVRLGIDLVSAYNRFGTSNQC